MEVKDIKFGAHDFQLEQKNLKEDWTSLCKK